MTPGMNVLSPPTPPSAGTFYNFTNVGGGGGGGGWDIRHTEQILRKGSVQIH